MEVQGQMISQSNLSLH